MIKEKEIIPLVEEFVEVKHSEYSEFTLRNYKSNLLEFNRFLKERGRAIPEFTAEDLSADPRGEFLAANYAESVYDLFGLTGLDVDQMPYKNQARLNVHNEFR